MNIGDERIINKFCLFPKEINGDIRWMKSVKILQQYTEIHDYIYDYVEFDSVPVKYNGWKDIKFI